MTESQKEQNRVGNEKRRQDPEYRAKQREWNRNWHKRISSSAEFRARKAEQMSGYRRDPELAIHQSARRAVRTALASGLLTKKPCEVCGNKKVQGHHPDYSKPLDVIWLCNLHHWQVHSKAEGGTQ